MSDRDWTLAINKMRDENNTCRVCPSRSAVQCAHIIRREVDRKPTLGWTANGGGEWEKPWRVSATRIVPLCREHHADYDNGELDLLPFLTVWEVLQAVADCAHGKSNGLETARRRLTGSREVAQQLPPA